MSVVFGLRSVTLQKIFLMQKFSDLFPVSKKTLVAICLASVVVGLMASSMALLLKHLTEAAEEISFEQASENPVFFWLFPVCGLMLIGVIRTVFFKRKKNKGIAEVFESLGPGKKLPQQKVWSHFVNGLLTVASGGSTGIEVSTVVATAAIGSEVHRNQTFFRKHRRELVCAGIAAGITALFNSPLAGIFFCYEVISKKKTPILLLATMVSTGAALALGIFTSEHPLIAEQTKFWKWEALPFFGILAVLTALLSVYLTRLVLLFKKWRSGIQSDLVVILAGSIALGTLLFFFPGLFGDSYHSIHEVLKSSGAGFNGLMLLSILALIVLKPLAVSLTLASGGDGGVFAPSLVIGAWAGLLVCVLSNKIFGTDLIPLNFMLVGMAAALSAAIHAPLTAVFLVCGISGSYVLMVPLLLVSFLSKTVSFRMLPYNVYTYKPA